MDQNMMIIAGVGAVVVIGLALFFVLGNKKSQNVTTEDSVVDAPRESSTDAKIDKPSIKRESDFFDITKEVHKEKEVHTTKGTHQTHITPRHEENLVRSSIEEALDLPQSEQDKKDDQATPPLVFPSQDSSKITVYKELMEETPNVTPDSFKDFEGSSLMIVEDNLINQKILTSVLRTSNMNISIANNGQEALDYLEAGKIFDVVLMDISMPVMDGFVATQAIRQNPAYDKMPIVTFTAFTVGDEIERMFEMGANAFMTKPLNNRRLYTILKTFLSK